MKISARNQLAGTVMTVTEGAVMAEVLVEIDGGHEIVSAITAESVRRLDLAPGSGSSPSSSRRRSCSPSMTEPVIFPPIGVIETTRADALFG